MEENKKIIAACGNNCAVCPRYVESPYEKSAGEMKRTAELWMKIGYRDRLCSYEELACHGCKPENSCRYEIVKCVSGRGLNNCGECTEYPCDRTEKCFEGTDSFKPACRAACTEEEYLMIKRAFFEKKKNLDRAAYRVYRLKGPEKEYKFYGWQNADVPPISAKYRAIKDPRELYDLLNDIWCIETCAPRLRESWSEENRTLGQCSITAFLAQDIFGGKVLGIKREGGNFHCFNAVGECVFDLTSEQFGDEVLDYSVYKEQPREVHFMKVEKRLRYEYLKAELEKKICALHQQAK